MSSELAALAAEVARLHRRIDAHEEVERLANLPADTRLTGTAGAAADHPRPVLRLVQGGQK